jgi:hypothetical protein
MPGQDWYAEEVGAQRLDVALADLDASFELSAPRSLVESCF